ncbi:MAG: 50S ribosomal protein L2 [Thermoplasmata archaeon]|nr:50S ribosomal protein L2 [Thermoplasmata archaeon]
MGKRIRTRRRGKGSRSYSSPSHRHHGKVAYPPYEDEEGNVTKILRNPGRSATLAKVSFPSGTVLMIAPEGLQEGQTVTIGKTIIDRGNTLPVGDIPESTLIFNVESMPGDGGKFARTAGSSAVVVSHGRETVVQLPSGKYKNLNPKCRASIGVVSAGGVTERPFAKAGKKFHVYQSKAKRARRVSGVAMNPVNHPHGGGAHQHVGKPSTVSANAPPGRKVGRLSPKKKKKGRR